ncbi:MAG: PG0541 family transporter-associated protein [Bacteroidales bacterium]
MKAAFIVYNQAFVKEVEQVLHQLNIRGYTKWDDVKGKGSKTGEPHLGSHAWPSKNMATLCIVDDNIAPVLKKRIQVLDSDAPEQGLRVFFWEVVDV